VQGLGLEYAKSLAAAGCRCLVLTGRSPALPPEALAVFAAAGVTVFTVAADAGDPTAWASLLGWAHERLPALQHFAHAAGVTGFDLLQVSEAVGHSNVLKSIYGELMHAAAHCHKAPGETWKHPFPAVAAARMPVLSQQQ
jgi:NAD(P)-dependent dehydrogenase (short-subunit alcohol dehydrogenase family)